MSEYSGLSSHSIQPVKHPDAVSRFFFQHFVYFMLKEFRDVWTLLVSTQRDQHVTNGGIADYFNYKLNRLSFKVNQTVKFITRCVTTVHTCLLMVDISMLITRITKCYEVPLSTPPVMLYIIFCLH